MPESLLTLEHALQRGGDDLYRTALLLTPNPQDAATALLAAARRLQAAPPTAPDETALLDALLDALPPERLRRLPGRVPLPEWARTGPPEHAATLAALARLPRQQRLVLGLAILRGWDAEQIVPLGEHDVDAVQRITRDALLALAPHATPELDPAALRGDDQPTACQASRAALGLNDAALRYDPAVRGHLALCAECRAAEQGWQQLVSVVEQTLRAALRPARMPAALSEQVQAVLAPSAETRPRSGLRTHWRRALLPLGILALIALLVLPRARPSAPESATLAAASATPGELVQRAADTLYQPPASELSQHPDDLWHGRWQMRWNFGDNSYATLNGELWNDLTNNRHRVQLVHEAGGGPFEFELADGKQQVKYAVTANYGRSLYPLLFNNAAARLTLQVPADEQPAMLQARLDAGAWGLAGAYLRQAQQASDLRSWGRQRAADGTPLEVLGFSGTSPLGLPPGAPDRMANAATILLTIDRADGTLREVRELTGPDGGEQVGQTTWRFAGGEWISAAPQISAAFSLQQAWNGVGTFQNTLGPVVAPALPMIMSASVRPLASALTDQWAASQLPQTPPPGATSALLFEDLTSSSYPSGSTAAYVGDDRLLTIRGVWLDGENGRAVNDLIGDTFEQVELGGKTVRLHPSATQRYDVLVTDSPKALLQGQAAVQLSARGYSRAELLQIIGTLAPLDLAGLQAQFELFANPQPDDSAVREALLRALAPPAPLPPDTTRHITARTFTRHGDQVDTLSDPYHQPLFGGRPEELISETWVRTQPNGSLDAVASRTRAADGTLYTSMVNDLASSRIFDAPTNYAQKGANWTNGLPTSLALTPGQTTALRMLECGGARLVTLANGRRAVVKLEQQTLRESCLHPEYKGLADNQAALSELPPYLVNQGPYVLDLALQGFTAFTTWLYLDDAGLPTRVEVRARDSATSELVESWEPVGDEQVPNAEVPPDVFSETPPPALVFDDYTNMQSLPISNVGMVTLKEAADLLQTPLWQLVADEDVRFVYVEANVQGGVVRTDISSVFDNAVLHGFAARLTYQVTSADDVKTVQIYEGSAERFGAFLRAQARWVSSQPVTLRAAGRDVNGWLVVTPDNMPWTLFELDGTLIAVDKAVDVLDGGVLEALEPVAP